VAIFVSYSHRDNTFADQLRADLQGAGFKVWIDREDIPAGDTWTGSIADAIEQCEAFIVILSPSSVASDNVVKEVILASDLKKRIFPVYAAQCEPSRDLRYPLSGRQYVNLAGAEYPVGLPRLIAAIRNEKPDPALPPAQPPRPVEGPSYPPPFAPPVQPVPFPNLYGTWDVQFQHPLTGLGGYGRVILTTMGFQGQLTAVQGTVQIQGSWQFLNGQIVLQGTMFSPMIGNQPYALYMSVAGYTATQVSFAAATGEQVLWTRA
jgi:hypothetical protein